MNHAFLGRLKVYDWKEFPNEKNKDVATYFPMKGTSLRKDEGKNVGSCKKEKGKKM